jgi:hypothetical protein
MTPVNLFWLVAGLFHTYQKVLLLPIASNTSVQLLHYRKNESRRLDTWRYSACTINLPIHLNCPHYWTRGGAAGWGNALWPWGRFSLLTRNEYQGGKGGRCVGLISSSLCALCLEILGASTYWNPPNCSGRWTTGDKHQLYRANWRSFIVSRTNSSLPSVVGYYTPKRMMVSFCQWQPKAFRWYNSRSVMLI